MHGKEQNDNVNVTHKDFNEIPLLLQKLFQRGDIKVYKRFKKRIVFFTIFYILLTLIKFFTVNIDTIREEDPTIYFKFYPTVENTIKPVIDPGELSDYYYKKYPWYERGEYWEIIHSRGGSFIVSDIYYTLIVLWWILSILLVLYALYKLNRPLQEEAFSRGEGGRLGE